MPHRKGVSRERVVGILELNGVDVSETLEADGRIRYTLAKDDIVEAQYLPGMVPRHMLGRFAHKFGFNMGDFWEPDLISKIDEASPPAVH
jgi:hypothetical protein